jgi:hypothetical protein
VIADEEELGAAVRSFHRESCGFVGGEDRHARQHAPNGPAERTRVASRPALYLLDHDGSGGPACVTVGMPLPDSP